MFFLTNQWKVTIFFFSSSCCLQRLWFITSWVFASSIWAERAPSWRRSGGNLSSESREKPSPLINNQSIYKLFSQLKLNHIKNSHSAVFIYIQDQKCIKIYLLHFCIKDVFISSIKFSCYPESLTEAADRLQVQLLLRYLLPARPPVLHRVPAVL